MIEYSSLQHVTVHEFVQELARALSPDDGDPAIEKDETPVDITALRLVHHLRRMGFVMMKRPCAQKSRAVLNYLNYENAA